jgi:DNA-binding FrmR family transcriptional regulator
VRRIRGQIEGVERALEADAACGEILRQIASMRGALNGLMAQLMEDHLNQHVLAAETDTTRRQGGEELVGVIRAYLR